MTNKNEALSFKTQRSPHKATVYNKLTL